ncbi:hypothetical protein FQN53_006251, partial [Emmonsiellopsis sp. PD_33]
CPFIPHKGISVTQKWIVTRTFTFLFVILLANDPTGRIIDYGGTNEFVPVTMMGYTIHPDEWGKGYATEFAPALVKAWFSLPWREDRKRALCCTRHALAICRIQLV